MLLIAKRAGDYYMFEHDPDTDDLLEESSATYLSEMAGDGENERLNTAQVSENYYVFAFKIAFLAASAYCPAAEFEHGANG